MISSCRVERTMPLGKNDLYVFCFPPCNARFLGCIQLVLSEVPNSILPILVIQWEGVKSLHTYFVQLSAQSGLT